MGDALQAAAIGGAIGGASAYVGAGFIAPALSETVMPWVAAKLMGAGLSQATAGSMAQVAVYGAPIAGGLATTGQQAAKGNYAPLIALGVAIGLHAVLVPPPAEDTGLQLVSTKAEEEIPTLSVRDLRRGDVLITDDGPVAAITEHAAIILDADPTVIKVLSADNRGTYIETNLDSAVGGRQWDVFRVRGLSLAKLRTFSAKVETNGGIMQYLGDKGGNVCSSTVAKALEQSGGPFAPRFVGNLVLPSQLRATYGPPIGRVFIPKLGGI